MYNLRYHIASLVGVFLALALGLVLGGLVVQRGTVDRQQGALVEGLRNEFATLRSDNAQLTAENETLDDFARAMGDEWIVDRLVGQRVAVVANSGRTDGVGEATDAVEAAGGSVVSIVILKSQLGLDDEELRTRLTSATEVTPDVVASVATSLAAEWAEPMQERPVTDALVEAGVLAVEGLEPGMAVAGMVNLAANGKRPDTAGLAMLVAFSQLEDAAIGAESTAHQTGVAGAAAERGLGGFDTLGTALGRYTLVAMLTGAEPGLYGLSDSAVAEFPEPPSK